MKRFACIWLPTFPIDRMRRLKPASVPRDKPLALVESGARGIVVSAVNSLASAAGIHVGQMLADARAVLPGLLVRPGEPDRDARALRQLALWLGRYGPSRNVDGNNGLWVDITGVAHLFGGEAALAHDCVDRLECAGFYALVAIADTRSGAFAAARHGRMQDRTLITEPGNIRAALADLPVEGLQLTYDLVLLLRRLGLKRIGQLYPLPRAALTRRFRDAGASRPTREKREVPKRNRSSNKSHSAYSGWSEALVMRLDLALGELKEPARGIVEPPLYRVQRTYPEPLISHDGIVAALDDLAADLCRVLDRKDEGARALRFAVYRADGSLAEVAVRTSRPAREARHITELFSARLERIDAGLGIDAIVLEAMVTERLSREQKSFASAYQNASSLGGDPSLLIDRLSNRLGSDAVFHVDPVESHIPERAARRIPALRAGEHIEPRHQAAYQTPRPAFLLEPAEPIAVIAEVPDGPPARFTWRRVTRRVVRSEGPERIAPEWWRLLASRPSACKPADRIRDYYHVEDEYGGLYWIYRAGLYPQSLPVEAPDRSSDQQLTVAEAPAWYLQGLF